MIDYGNERPRCTECNAPRGGYGIGGRTVCRACYCEHKGWWWKLEDVPAHVTRLFQVSAINEDGDRVRVWTRADADETDEQVLARAIERMEGCGSIHVEEEIFEMPESDADTVVAVLLAEDIAREGGR